MNKIALALVVTFTASVCHAEGKISGELLVGKADQESEVSGLSISGGDTSIGIRGSYLFNKNIAIEFAYRDYGESEDSYIDEFGDTITETLETSAIAVGVKGVIPLDNGFSLNGRIGISKWDYDIKETGSALPGEFTADGTDLYYGIGAQYQFNEKVFIGLQYTITKMDVSLVFVSVDHEVKDISLSLGVNF